MKYRNPVIIRSEVFAQGAMAAGGRLVYDAGRQPFPCSLIAIRRDAGAAGTVNALATLTIQKGEQSVDKTAFFENVLTTNDIFSSALAGGSFLYDIPLQQGDFARFVLVATGVHGAMNWNFLFASLDFEPSEVRKMILNGIKADQGGTGPAKFKQ